jgi:Holliday junction resolvase RusA-like endonuclease
MTSFTLPMPPSTNSIWRAVKGRNIMSEEYRAWKIEAGQALNAQRPEKHSGRVHVSIVLCAGDNRRRDLDNRLKAPLDLIKAHGVIVDDDSRYVRRLTAEWADEGPECLVTITPAEAPELNPKVRA